MWTYCAASGPQSGLSRDDPLQQTHTVRNYGQFCPIARGSEILAERWTPIIMRNVLMGCDTFNEIAAGAPGLSRTLLVRRLRELERAGVLTIRPKSDGRGSRYEPTPAGRDLEPVLQALGAWAEQWVELTVEHADPGLILWSWCRDYLRTESLPDRRVVIRFEYVRRSRTERAWFLIDRHDAEVCLFDPGFGDDLVVAIEDPLAFARWHTGLLDWTALTRSGAIRITGPRLLRQALPTWNAGPQRHVELRAMHGIGPSEADREPVRNGA